MGVNAASQGVLTFETELWSREYRCAKHSRN